MISEQTVRDFICVGPLGDGTGAEYPVPSYLLKYKIFAYTCICVLGRVPQRVMNDILRVAMKIVDHWRETLPTTLPPGLSCQYGRAVGAGPVGPAAAGPKFGAPTKKKWLQQIVFQQI